MTLCLTLDNAGNRKAAMVAVTLTAVTAPTQPQPPATPTGETVEGEGVITSVIDDFIQVDNTTVTYFDANTAVTFNDVSGFENGLPVQYKGIQTENGDIFATDLVGISRETKNCLPDKGRHFTCFGKVASGKGDFVLRMYPKS